MARFVFNLETLLRHREEIEQKEKDELLKRNYRLQTERDRCEGLNTKLRETLKELSLKQTGNIDQQELNLFYLYANRLTHEIKESEQHLAELQAEVEQQKEAVIEASKKRKVLASLKSRKEKEFIDEQEKQEQKEIDDLVITRYTAGESGIGNKI